MKKLIIFTLLLAFLGCSSILKAQSLAVFMGVKMGPSFANFEGKGVSNDLKQRIGFGFGLVSDFSIKKSNDKDYSRWSLCPEINFIPGGAKGKSTLIDTTTNTTVESNDITSKFNYLNIPVMIRFYHGILGKAKSGLFAEIGPYGSYLLSAKRVGTVTTNNKSTDIDEDVKADFENTDYGISFGGGVSIASILTVNYRYNWGMVNISKYKEDVTNRSWGIYFNLTLPIGGK